MIRVETTQADLEQAIRAANNTWMDRAKARTREYAKAKKYTGGTEFWGDIKKVYIQLQHEKCAYCESKMAGVDLASKVHEVEHYRPKSRVRKWPAATKTKSPAYIPPCECGDESASGYYLLAYHPLNYAIACTRCNSTLKSDYFPVAGNRTISGAEPAQLLAEKPLLVYPIGDLDDDPARLIRFDGVLAVPRVSRGPRHHRALVTIEFFQLNHEDLASRRAPLIANLFVTLEAMRVGKLTSRLRKDHETVVEAAADPKSQFSACARDYVELYESDLDKASEYGQLALKLTRL